MQYERNTIYGRKVRQEEYDILPALRAKNDEFKQGSVRLMRFRKKRQVT